MEIAKYLMSILKTQLMIVWSWGFHNAVALPNNEGLRFNVQGLKFKGVVEVVYDEGWDLFNVRFIKANEVVNTIEGVYFDTLVDTIDFYVEKDDSFVYGKRVKEQYSNYL